VEIDPERSEPHYFKNKESVTLQQVRDKLKLTGKHEENETHEEGIPNSDRPVLCQLILFLFFISFMFFLLKIS
jgi:hypothetical protein